MDISLHFAQLLADKIIQSAQTNDHGQYYWEIERLSEVSLQPEIILSDDLYKGNAGIAFFLFHLGQAIPDNKRLNEIVGNIKLWSDKKPDDLYKGLYNGYYGNAYVNLLIDSQDPKSWAFIRADTEHATHGYDVISGHSGCILALLLILRDIDLSEFNQTLIHQKIIVHLQYLLESVSIHGTHIVMNRPDYENWGGYSHGQQGAAYVLRLLAELYNFPLLLHLAQSIQYFEEDAFQPELLNYKDLRSRVRHRQDFKTLDWKEVRTIEANDRTEMYAWCHGIPGIISAQEQTERHDPLSHDKLQRNEQIMHEILHDLLSDNRKCLCHGTAGNLDYFLNRSTDKQPVVDSKILQTIFDEIEKDLDINGKLVGEDCGLMCGLAGIGYFFLRNFAPQQFRSILAPVGLAEMTEIRSKSFVPSLSTEKIFRKTRLSDLQLHILEKLMHQPYQQFIAPTEELAWEVKKTTFRSDFNLDHRELHHQTVKQNSLVEKEANLKTVQFILQNNFIINNSGNQLFFFLGNQFHETIVSDAEIAILTACVDLQHLDFSHFQKWLADEKTSLTFVTQLAHIGFFKLSKQ